MLYGIENCCNNHQKKRKQEQKERKCSVDQDSKRFCALRKSHSMHMVYIYNIFSDYWKPKNEYWL